MAAPTKHRHMYIWAEKERIVMVTTFNGAAVLVADRYV